MANEKQPIMDVRKFMEDAVRLGCYSKTQQYNFETAWAVLLKTLPGAGLSEASPIEQLRPKIEELLKHHGRSTKISHTSLKAYQARIKKLLDDFQKYNGTDFMAWKEQISKAPSGGSEGKARRRSKPSTRSQNGDGGSIEEDMMTYRLIAGEGLEGKIELPKNLSEEQVDSVWGQLTAIQTLVKAQNAALKGKPKGGE